MFRRQVAGQVRTNSRVGLLWFPPFLVNTFLQDPYNLLSSQKGTIFKLIKRNFQSTRCVQPIWKNSTQTWKSSPIFGVKKNKQKIETTIPQNGIFTNKTTKHLFSGHRLLSLVKRTSFHAPPWCTSARSAAACSWNWWSPNSLGIVVCRWWKRFVILNEMKKLQEIAVHWNEALEVIVCTIIIHSNTRYRYHYPVGFKLLNCSAIWIIWRLNLQQEDEEIWRTRFCPSASLTFGHPDGRSTIPQPTRTPQAEQKNKFMNLHDTSSFNTYIQLLTTITINKNLTALTTRYHTIFVSSNMTFCLQHPPETVAAATDLGLIVASPAAASLLAPLVACAVLCSPPWRAATHTLLWNVGEMVEQVTTTKMILSKYQQRYRCMSKVGCSSVKYWFVKSIVPTYY